MSLAGGTGLEGKLSVKIDGRSIIDVCNLSIGDCLEFFKQITLSTNDLIISEVILKEVKARLQFLLDVGLDYLQLKLYGIYIVRR